MPMKTTLERREGPPASWPDAEYRAAATTWSTISAVERLRVKPAWPVAQNGQAMPHPACDETHAVVRSGERMRTDSTSAPSNSRQTVFRVAPLSHVSARASVSRLGKQRL